MTHFPNQDAATMVAVDGTDALAFVIIRPGTTEGGVSIEAAAKGLSKPAAAHVLRHVAGLWDAENDTATATEAGKDTRQGEFTRPTGVERLRARVAAQEAALHDALTRVVATVELRTERDLAQARVANLETAARSAAVLLRSAATLSDTGQQLDPDTLRLAATCLDEAAKTTDGGAQS